MTAGHRTGSGTCGDGGRWGHDWQSSWWAAKMAHGARLIWEQLTAAERDDVERVVASEASAHLGRSAPSGLFLDTKAEENAWDSEILAAALGLFPDHPDAPLWREKLVEFAVNTLSAPQDRESDEPVDGRPLRDQVYTVNLHGDFTLENHGSCHFCYVASPLASVAWSVHALARSGRPAPEAIFHHVGDLWRRFKGTFLGSRFAYLGGQDWARYTYGEYFIVPALALIQYRFGDPDARAVEAARVRTLEREQEANGDGSFFGRRVTRGVYSGQSAKYESDCFAALGLAYLLHRSLGPPEDSAGPEDLGTRLAARHLSPESGTCFVRTPALFASFSWTCLGRSIPSAQFIPEGMEHAAEWAAGNLLGRVEVPGLRPALFIRTMVPKGEGFEVSGVVLYPSRGGFALEHRLRFRVVPEERRAEVESTFLARSKVVVLSREGLQLYVANDFFNDFGRSYAWDGGSRKVGFDPERASRPRPGRGRLGRLSRKLSRRLGLGEERVAMGARWVNIDDKLGVIRLAPGGGPFVLRCPDDRNVAGSLHCDVLGAPARSTLPRVARAGELILRTRFLLLAGTAAETEALDARTPRAAEAGTA